MAKIFIVDDDLQIRCLIRRHLKNPEYDFFEADSGRVALGKLNEILPEVILLDIMMPEMNGFDVCKAIRSNPRYSWIYIIFLSAKNEVEAKVHGLDLGADDYVTKPFDRNELNARVRKGISSVVEKKAAIYDPLTKLYNRFFLLKRIKEEIDRSKRYGHSMSMILMDLDHFKEINDCHGHQAGDGVLCEVARMMQMVCREVDIPVRWGGDELLILLPETDVWGARRMAERLRKTIKDFQFQSVGAVTASFGVSDIAPDLERMISAADVALYESKQSGRNRVTVGGLNE